MMALIFYMMAIVVGIINAVDAQNCITPSPPRNGTVKETKDWQGNKMLHFSCVQGYILVGSEVLTCEGNEWSDEVPQCGVTDCQTHYKSGSLVDGIYEIIPDGQHPLRVLCNMSAAAGGKTIFHPRLSNITPFNEDWKCYKESDGDIQDNFSYGKDILNQATRRNRSELYIKMEDCQTHCCKGSKGDDLQGCPGTTPSGVFKDCQSHYLMGSRLNGPYDILPDGQHTIRVLCDMTTAGGGWTVFQQRLNNLTDFYRDWKSYKEGFRDNKNGENFWLGLDTLYQMTRENKSELYIEMEGDLGDVVYARYQTFQVGSEVDQYRLTVGGYSGTAGDSLSYHNHMTFSTKDRDNDMYNSVNCARRDWGAWWYNKCHYSNLNGLYLDGSYSSGFSYKGIRWHYYNKMSYFSMRRTKMMVR